MNKTIRVFRNRTFLLFWLGACVSNIGNWTENAAQSWAVTSQTAGNPHQGLLVEILQFADFCPVLFLSLFAGAISDRVNRKVWLIVLQSCAFLFGIGLAVAAFYGKASPWVVIGFTFMEGVVWSLNGPVFLSVVPGLVPRGELDTALAANSVQFNIARLCGPMLAAALISIFGIFGAFSFNACSFLPLLFVLIFAIPNKKALTRKSKSSIFNDIADGLKFVWTSPGTRRLTIMGGTFMFLTAPLQGLLPVFAQRVLHGGPSTFGLMLSAIGLGSILGAFFLSYIPSYYPRHHLIPLSMCLFSVLGVLFSFSTTVPVSLVALVACGAFWLLSLNPSNTANQLLASDENRGRVLSVMLLAQQGSMPLGHLFAGFLTHYLTVPWVLRLMLGVLFVIMTVFLFVREPAIDKLPRRNLPQLNFWDAIVEAVTAFSHHPDYPGDICTIPKKPIQAERK